MAIWRSPDTPNQEEIDIGWLPSSGPFQIVTALAVILFKVAVLLMLILVSAIADPVLFVIVVNNCFAGAPEIVMIGFAMEPQASTGVFVGVGVRVSVEVDVGVEV